MPREFHRTQRLGEQIRRVLSELLQSVVSDPRLGLVSVTEVQVARDLSVARVYYSSLDPAAEPQTIQQGLESAAGFLRGRLGRALTVRSVPALRFVFDDRALRAERLDALIESAVAEDIARHTDSD